MQQGMLTRSYSLAICSMCIFSCAKTRRQRPEDSRFNLLSRPHYTGLMGPFMLNILTPAPSAVTKSEGNRNLELPGQIVWLSKGTKNALKSSGQQGFLTLHMSQQTGGSSSATPLNPKHQGIWLSMAGCGKRKSYGADSFFCCCCV